MDTESMRVLFGYNRWVNGRLMATAEKVPEERRRESFGMSFDTIHGTLAHILSGQIFSLSRWQGEPLPGMPDVGASEGLQAIQENWRRHDEQLDAFLAALTDERLQSPVRHTHPDGRGYDLPLWQAMVHTVIHGTHHRSELADMLTRTGHEPDVTGFRWFCLELQE